MNEHIEIKRKEYTEELFSLVHPEKLSLHERYVLMSQKERIERSFQNGAKMMFDFLSNMTDDELLKYIRHAPDRKNDSYICDNTKNDKYIRDKVLELLRLITKGKYWPENYKDYSDKTLNELGLEYFTHNISELLKDFLPFYHPYSDCYKVSEDMTINDIVIGFLLIAKE